MANQTPWRVFDVSDDLWCGPTRRKVLAMVKDHRGCSTRELREMQIAELTPEQLRKRLVDDDGKPVDTTIAAARDLFQKGGRTGIMARSN
jgi:hypothetical protein